MKSWLTLNEAGISGEKLPEKTKRTFALEIRRCIAAGVYETAIVTFLLLIAIRHFGASPGAKSLLLAGINVGLLFSPGVVYWAYRFRMTPPVATALLFAMSAVSLCFAGIVSTLTGFLCFCGIATLFTGSTVPLLTQIYQDNYPTSIRGKLFARGVSVRIITSIVFGYLAGEVLSGRIYLYRGLIFIYALALAFSAYCLSRIPASTRAASEGNSLFEGFRYLRSDRVFRLSTISWVLYGSASFLMVPLRVEFLADPRYGFNLPETQIALYVSVLPNIARLIMNPIWGPLFDNLNFFRLRILMIVLFFIGIFSFFSSSSHAALAIGAIIYGAAFGGSEIAWGLWVTKFAPHDKVAEYMSVHVFFTGLRGTIVPAIGFYLSAYSGIGIVEWISAVLVFLAIVPLIIETKYDRTNIRTGVEPEAAIVTDQGLD